MGALFDEALFDPLIFDCVIPPPPTPPPVKGGRKIIWGKEVVSHDLLEAYAKYLRLRLGEPI